jgi:hypothetical protein
MHAPKWRTSRPKWRIRRIGAGAVMGLVLGCGPELVDDETVPNGYYRARALSVGEAAVCVPSGDGLGACLLSEAYRAHFADPVPIRTDRDRIQLPEPWAVPSAIPSDSPSYGSIGPINAWMLQPLLRDGSLFTSSTRMQADSPTPWCWTITWSAIPLDEETLFVMRDTTPCDGTGPTSVVEVEYVLEQACEPPCMFVDERERLFPDLELGDDILLQSSQCAC